jgi:hypothetical protein
MGKLQPLSRPALVIMLLVSLAACSGKANNSAAAASKFIGTWKTAPESAADFKGGPITFKEDYTYTAEGTAESPSGIVTGPYTISKDEKLFLGGELSGFGQEGMKIEADGRLKFTKNGQTIYFVKGR